MTELPLKEDMTKSAIDYLEKQGYSIVEWVEFDSDDKTTWPDAYEDVLVCVNNSPYCQTASRYQHSSPYFCVDNVTMNLESITHWCELPKVNGE